MKSQMKSLLISRFDEVLEKANKIAEKKVMVAVEAAEKKMKEQEAVVR